MVDMAATARCGRVVAGKIKFVVIQENMATKFRCFFCQFKIFYGTTWNRTILPATTSNVFKGYSNTLRSVSIKLSNNLLQLNSTYNVCLAPTY